MYLQEKGGECDLSYWATNQTLWIALKNFLAWLYSTHTSKQVTIRCKNYEERVITIKGTGLVTSTDDCKLLTSEMYVKTRGVTGSASVWAHLSKYNLAVPEVALTHKKNHSDMKFKSVVNGKELIQISSKISEITESVSGVHTVWINSHGGMYSHRVRCW